MVTCTRSESGLMIVARPNQSASWRANLYTLLALCVPSLGVAIVFAVLGAWPILPFAGLEMLALGTALYYVNWKLQYRHVITLSEDSVRIDKGHYYPRQSWHLQRQRAGLSITPEQHPWEVPLLAVHDRSQRIGIGEFLNQDDARELITLLRRELSVDSHSAKGDRRF